ncbi:phosphate ABC transporter substrate-binding protein [Alteribacillus bidgolensis]|uniref:Phosphate-binding protein n=1 Tax=Alteribacillus bidgolensis TaxID=930129 RepID=A0A1G8MNE4_9BACI|nr:phosphate ABC transporter substrate-binding protein, PhoT family [Alteribacillus bidgolensis]
MSMKKVLMLIALAALMVVMAACGGGEEDANGGSEDTNNENTNEEEAADGESGSEEEAADGESGSEEEAADGESGSITVSGSSAMQPLVAASAEQYMAENPDASIQVQAGGSGTGLSQIGEGSVDIGNSDVFAEEKDGIPAEDLVDHQIAVVGMTAAINPEAGVEDLTMDELKDVFTGEITNWSELGGEDVDITLVNRPDSSGTRATFVKYGLDGEEPAEGITEDSSNTVKKIVSETEGAIGYLAFSYFEDDESVTPVKLDGVEPTDENVQSGDFPIWAYQHSYTNGEPEGLTEDFIDYMLSDQVQEELVPEMGYISSTNMQVERNVEGEISEIEE